MYMCMKLQLNVSEKVYLKKRSNVYYGEAVSVFEICQIEFFMHINIFYFMS